MGLQARMSEADRRLYNPGRDVAHNFQPVMNIVAGRLEDQQWIELNEVLEREGITQDDLGEACACYCTYVASAADPELTSLSMIEALRLSGFLECKPAAQVALFAMIGTAYAGMQFGGVREATMGGEGPLETIGEIAGHAERIRAYLSKSRWRRKLTDMKSKIVRSLAALRG